MTPISFEYQHLSETLFYHIFFSIKHTSVVYLVDLRRAAEDYCGDKNVETMKIVKRF
jgi:hypothetical protein